ncbi:MAG: DegT/DnrJ/EryC1/StrS aminotransferase family protein [Pseudomonadota bacterium]
MPAPDSRLEGLGPWPFFDADDARAVSDVLESGRVNYWTGGEGKRFEKAFAGYVGTPHGIALANGTLALELALRVLDIGEGDEVVVTPRSYFASASSIILSGARPVFADVDRDSQNLTAESVAAVLTPRTKAILPVHLAGWPCDMPALKALADANGIALIEDCAQAHGASIDGRSVGSFGDFGAFSFCQDKIMTTGGEGGFLTIRDERHWRDAWAFKDHGKNFDAVHHREHPLGFRWLHESVGTNWRLTEMQAVLGLRQLDRLEDWVAARTRHAAIYDDVLAGLPAVRVPKPPEGFRHAYYKYYLFVREAALASGWNRDRIMAEAVARGMPCFSGSCPEIYREKAITDLGLAPPERLPVARELGETSLMLLVHPTLSTDQVQAMAETLAAVLKEATRR